MKGLNLEGLKEILKKEIIPREEIPEHIQEMFSKGEDEEYFMSDFVKTYQIGDDKVGICPLDLHLGNDVKQLGFIALFKGTYHPNNEKVEINGVKEEHKGFYISSRDRTEKLFTVN